MYSGPSKFILLNDNSLCTVSSRYERKEVLTIKNSDRSDGVKSRRMRCQLLSHGLKSSLTEYRRFLSISLLGTEYSVPGLPGSAG